MKNYVPFNFDATVKIGVPLIHEVLIFLGDIILHLIFIYTIS